MDEARSFLPHVHSCRLCFRPSGHGQFTPRSRMELPLLVGLHQLRRWNSRHGNFFAPLPSSLPRCCDAGSDTVDRIFRRVFGAIYVTAFILLTPRLGIAAMAAFFISGQMIASLVVDHYGWLGVPVRPIDLQRLIGLLFVIAGAIFSENNSMQS